MSKATEQKLPSGAQPSKARSNYPGQELESNRVGLQDRLKEAVKDVTYDTKALPRARAALFASTGEPTEAPDLNDALNERAVTASKGSKSSKK